MNRPIMKLALAAAITLLVGNNARSESISFSYSYTVARPAEMPPHGIDVHFRSAPSTGVQSGMVELGATLALSPLSIVTSGPPPLAPITIPDEWRGIGFTMELKDGNSGDQVNLVLGGELTGEVGYDTSTMVLKISDSAGWAEARLGGYLYRVWLPDEVPVPSWAAGSVTLSPRITVRTLTSGEHAPEPSTLALGAVAALGLAARRWLRRRACSA